MHFLPFSLENKWQGASGAGKTTLLSSNLLQNEPIIFTEFIRRSYQCTFDWRIQDRNGSSQWPGAGFIIRCLCLHSTLQAIYYQSELNLLDMSEHRRICRAIPRSMQPVFSSRSQIIFTAILHTTNHLFKGAVVCGAVEISGDRIPHVSEWIRKVSIFDDCLYSGRNVKQWSVQSNY